MNEFQLIDQYFRRSTTRTLLGIGDDAAIVRPTRGYDLHISSDMLVAGQHFFRNVSAYALGHKSLAVNLSDMAAMGALPRWVLLSLALPQSLESWLSEFSSGWFALADKHNIELIGGDTTCGPLTISVTILGEAPVGQCLPRSKAQAEDDIWVSGQIGLAAIAVKNQTKRLDIPSEVLAECQRKLDFPTPRVSLGMALLPYAHACLDVSDGLVGDLEHILEQSGVGANVYLSKIPTCNWLDERREEFMDCLLAGGDDYELLFTAPACYHSQIMSLATVDCPLTCIGKVSSQHELCVYDKHHHVIQFHRKGFDHFTAT